MPPADDIARACGAAAAVRGERIQSLWSGYGEVVRYGLHGGPVDTVVVKHVTPGAGSGRSHDRKLRSYDVEMAWYRDWAPRCPEGCRVAGCFEAVRVPGGWRFVLEDLDASGFAGRAGGRSTRERDAMLRWLATLHATFLGERPRGLWRTGSYWHLKTRPDELTRMASGPLKSAAVAIDARLAGAAHRTIVHGDAKPANFCVARDGAAVAAVDFQYVGGGTGVRDVAYLLWGEAAGPARAALDVYFARLRRVLGASGHDAVVIAAVEAEWRDLYPWACADFQRFLAGWSPGHRAHGHAEALTAGVLASL